MLGNTYVCLRDKKELNIGYFGGSITEGAGASNADETSWRSFVTSWFKKNYKNCEINEINAAIGGTGSDLGAYRCQIDLLQYKPDLIFIEFAVNDYKRNSEKIKCNLEGIIRQIRKSDLQTDIVLVYTITKAMYEQDYTNNRYPESIQIHQQIADHYGLLTINIGEVLLHHVVNEKKKWEDLLPDAVHPNDAAYQIYADAMIQFLQDKISPIKSKELVLPLYSNCVENGILVDAWEALGCWKKEEISLKNRYPHRRSSNKIGEELVFRFSGTDIGLYWLISSDSGDIEWCLDDGEWQLLSSWDEYALQFDRVGNVLLATQLENREHCLKIKISEHKQELSMGHWVRIGAFLVNKIKAK